MARRGAGRCLMVTMQRLFNLSPEPHGECSTTGPVISDEGRRFLMSKYLAVIVLIRVVAELCFSKSPDFPSKTYGPYYIVVSGWSDANV